MGTISLRACIPPRVVRGWNKIDGSKTVPRLLSNSSGQFLGVLVFLAAFLCLFFRFWALVVIAYCRLIFGKLFYCFLNEIDLPTLNEFIQMKVKNSVLLFVNSENHWNISWQINLLKYLQPKYPQTVFIYKTTKNLQNFLPELLIKQLIRWGSKNTKVDWISNADIIKSSAGVSKSCCCKQSFRLLSASVLTTGLCISFCADPGV